MTLAISALLSVTEEANMPKTKTTAIVPANNNQPCHDFNLFSISVAF